MAERDPSELDLAAAFRAYLEDAPTQVRPTELARRFAAAYPHGTTTSGLWRLVAVPRRAWILLLLAGLLAALVGGTLFVGSRLQRRLPAVVPPIGQLFECPPGSTPDTPGPVDQARPAEERSATAFDRRAGRLVVVTESGEGIETWTFDVCTNTWMQMLPNQEPPGVDYSVQLVYDVDSDVTIGAFDGSVWAYDLQANTWTRKGSVALRGAPVAYDPVSGLVISVLGVIPGYSERLQLWDYDVETDTWTPIRQANAGPSEDVVIAYDASVDRLVAHGDMAYGATPYETWLLDIRSGTWSRSAAQRPAVVGWLTAPGIVYDEAAERTLIFKRDPLTAYDASADRWEILAGFRTPWDEAPSVYVYDAVNRRLVGWRVGGNRYQETAVVAFDLTTRKWTILLEPSGRSSSTPVPRPAPTSARTATPSGGTEVTDSASPVSTASPTPSP